MQNSGHGYFPKQLLFALFLMVAIISKANSQQYAYDALRFSFPYQTGTARFIGMGGALGALGADISCIANNPAGLGLIRSTEFSISPSMFFNITDAEYDDNLHSEDKFVFNFGNVGALYSRRYNKDKTTGIQFLNVGLAYQRVNNFNNNVFFNGQDSSFSMSQVFTDAAQGFAPGVLTPDFERLAYDTYLIDTGANNTTYQNLGLLPTDAKGFSRQSFHSGSTGEILLSGAINYSNKLYAGASFGVSILNYRRANNYSETDINNLSVGFNTLNFEEVVVSSGIGVNVKVGAIYRPWDWFRVGFAFHTPTWFSIAEDSYADLTTSLNFGQFTSTSGIQTFDYNITTPWRMQASLGFIAFKNAAIGIEYEVADYSNINLRPTSNQFLVENNLIDTVFATSHHAKFGFEVKLLPFQIRAGYHFQSDPFKSTTLLTNAFHHISGGAGFKAVLGKNKKKEKYLVIDLTYLATITNGEIAFNDYMTNPRFARLTTSMHNIIGTVCLQF